MNIQTVLIAGIANWTLKLFVAWVLWLVAVWLGLPDWATIALVAIGAVESRVKVKTYVN